MTGKTHFAAGEAAVLLLLHPSTPKELALCVGTAAIGSLLPDVDSTTSKSHKELSLLLSISTIALIIITALELHFDLGIIRLLQRETNLLRIVLGVAAFLMICGIGLTLPHRSFMHSITCLMLLSGIVWEIFPVLLPAFFVSMSSHLILDLLNRKGLQLFFPLDGRYCLHLCPASGRVNDMLCTLASTAALGGLSLSVYLMVQ